LPFSLLLISAIDRFHKKIYRERKKMSFARPKRAGDVHCTAGGGEGGFFRRGHLKDLRKKESRLGVNGMELVLGDQASKVGCGTGCQEFADPVVDPSKVKTPQLLWQGPSNSNPGLPSRQRRRAVKPGQRIPEIKLARAL
jgi:hypothetical protein